MRAWACALVAALVALTGCGSSSGSSSPPRTVETVRSQPAGITPSKSAQMICAGEAQQEVAASLSVEATQVTTPTWVDHVYACKYIYPNGVISLSVKELHDSAATTSYFAALGRQLGRRREPLVLGQGAFTTADGSAVVRKDFKVLDVDVSQLPAQFGPQAQDRSNVALSVAATIMGCWTGA